MSPYAEPEYRTARTLLERDVYGCWHRCGRRATTPDHVPPLAEHRHVAGSGCCELRPSCAPCNLASGAAVGNRRRRATSRARLAPGSGSVLGSKVDVVPRRYARSLSPTRPDPDPVIMIGADVG